ncbi:MAG TPA: DUF192 domain-containing protein [Burkholderiales bacterium]
MPLEGKRQGFDPAFFVYLQTRNVNLKRGLVAAVAMIAQGAFAQLPTMELAAGVHLIRAEVAYTFEARAQGLMFRKHLASNQGMLFAFPQTERHCMWMKNTLIPLSVAFADEKGRIVSISEMQPQTETTHCAARPAKFALEMGTGWFAARGIKPGSSLRGLEKAPAAR